MKLLKILMLTATIGIFGGCVHQDYQLGQPKPYQVTGVSTLTIYDVAENILADEQIPIRGWASLEIVMREGKYNDSDGVFVKINGNVRFVPWLDLIAGPLGQRFYSDAFVKAGELTLRVTKAPCGGRLPLMFQVRELAPKTMRRDSTERPSIDEIGYVSLSNWTESGLFLPERLSHQIDDRWGELECQPTVAPTRTALLQENLANSLDIHPAIFDAKVAIEAATKPKAMKVVVDPWGKPCRRCRKEENDNGYDSRDEW